MKNLRTPNRRGLSSYLIGLRAKTGQAFFGDVDLQRFQRLDQHVEADIKLQLVDQQRLWDVLLDYGLLGLWTHHQFHVGGIADEVDAVPLGPPVWFDNESGVHRRVLLLYQTDLWMKRKWMKEEMTSWRGFLKGVKPLCHPVYKKKKLYRLQLIPQLLWVKLIRAAKKAKPFGFTDNVVLTFIETIQNFEDETRFDKYYNNIWMGTSQTWTGKKLFNWVFCLAWCFVRYFSSKSCSPAVGWTAYLLFRAGEKQKKSS